MSKHATARARPLNFGVRSRMDRRGTIDRQCHWKISNADGSATANEVAVIAVARSPARFRAPGLGRAVSNTPMATVAPNFMLGHSWHRLNGGQNYLKNV